MTWVQNYINNKNSPEDFWGQIKKFNKNLTCPIIIGGTDIKKSFEFRVVNKGVLLYIYASHINTAENDRVGSSHNRHYSGFFSLNTTGMVN